jgi:hypothetical protein
MPSLWLGWQSEGPILFSVSALESYLSRYFSNRLGLPVGVIPYIPD